MNQASAPKMDLDELRLAGYLQEANRRFFHPLGLALAVYTDGDGVSTLHVLDTREDVEGWSFDLSTWPDEDEARRDFDAKIDFIDEELAWRSPPRLKRMGYIVQPPFGDRDIEP